MADKVKLIIEIPKDIYARCKEYKLWSYDAETLEGAVATSKPLSEIKAEIEKKCDRINSIASVLRYPQHREIQELLCEILASIDNSESEDFPQAKDIEPTVESFKRTMDNVDKLMPEEKETDIGKTESED